MKRIFIAAIAVIFVAGVVFLRLAKNAQSPIVALTTIEMPLAEETPVETPIDYVFKVGERLTFVIAWQGIPIGTATSTVEEITTYKSHEVYKIVVKAGTNDFLSAIFKIRDSFITYMDTKTLESRCFEVSLREGSYKKDLVVDYDWDKMIATYNNLTNGSVKQSKLEPGSRDPVCASYYFRTLPLSPEDDIVLDVNSSEKNYAIGGSIVKETEMAIPNVGTFDAFLVEPYVKKGDEYENRVSVKGYVTQEPNRLLLLIKLRVLKIIPWLGEVTAKLDKIEYITPS